MRWSSAGEACRSSPPPPSPSTTLFAFKLISSLQPYLPLLNFLPASSDAKFNVGAMMLGGFGVAKDYSQVLLLCAVAICCFESVMYFILEFYEHENRNAVLCAGAGFVQPRSQYGGLSL